ncbi:MAG: amidase [Alphaproteobacteria bacterium]|nr:amidase [Alphaproteobacteria bacterium]
MTRDDLGAFVAHCDKVIEGAQDGLLSGLDLAVKDIFDVAGCHTGCGNPDWLRTHEPAEKSAPVVQKLVDAGATMIGKTVTEEMAFSIVGENHFYGAPVNINAPGRVAGGSSSGSAAAVAAGDAHMALGSDTGGSVRIPASFCGIYGLRPTHGRIPLEGIMPLAASYDTIGWFARDPAVMSGVAHILFDDWQEPDILTRLYVPEDLWALADTPVQAALAPALEALEKIVNPAISMLAAENYDIENMFKAYLVLQGREAWETHRDWIKEVNPTFGPGIAERFEFISKITDDEIAHWNDWRNKLALRINDMMTVGAVMAIPTSPCVAMFRGEPQDQQADARRRILTMTGLAGHCGLPQINIPYGTVDGAPTGFSIIARKGGDETLIDIARRLAQEGIARRP